MGQKLVMTDKPIGRMANWSNSQKGKARGESITLRGNGTILITPDSQGPGRLGVLRDGGQRYIRQTECPA